MSVSDLTSWKRDLAAGGETFTDYSFKIFAAGDLQVYRNGVLQTLTTNYTVGAAPGGNYAGLHPDEGGRITWVSPASLTAGDIIVVVRDIARTRTTDFAQGGVINAATLNEQLDRIEAYQQEDEFLLRERAITFPVTDDVVTLTTALPDAATRASRFLAFDANGNIITVVGSGAAVGSLNDLSDVTISGPTNDEILAYDSASGAFVHETLAVAGIATASHTHPAADIVTGTLVHERGGLEADVSTYNGLVRISGGVTTNITNLAGLDTALGATNIPDSVASSTDNRVVRMDGVGGDIQESGVTINDTDHVSGVASITLDEQSSDPSAPAAGDFNIFVRQAPTQHLMAIDDAGTTKHILRYIDRDRTMYNSSFLSASSSKWSDTAGIAGTVSSVAAQTVTYGGFTADDEAMFDMMANSATVTNRQIWVRNTTRSQNVRIDMSSFDIAANTFVVDTDYNITAWANADVLDFNAPDIGATGGTGLLFFSLKEDIEQNGLDSAAAMLVQHQCLDSGTIGGSNTAPWARIRLLTGSHSQGLGLVICQVASRYLNQDCVIPLYNGTDDEKGSFAYEIDATGSQTFIPFLYILGYFA